MLFKPQISLMIGKGGSYTLIARTQVPDGCHVSGDGTVGLPSGSVGIPEHEYVTLEIERRQGICTEALKYVHHMVEGISPGSDKVKICALAVVDDQVRGGSCIDLDGLAKIAEEAESKGLQGDSAEPGVHIIPSGVSAVREGGIVGNDVLRVSGVAQTPTPGYELSLAVNEPPGINPSILMLELEVKGPSGPVIQIPSIEGFYFEDMGADGKGYKGNHTHVSILNGEKVVTVQVIQFFA